MFERYHSFNGGRGSLAEVWIDKDAKLVKKYYKINGITIQNRLPFHNTVEEINKLYKNEIYWSTKLKSDLVVKTHEHGKLDDQFGYYILQEWPGPDLLQYPRKDLNIVFPNITAQIEHMFKFFKQHNMYKTNNAMANLTGKNGQLMCFDFKYAVTRTAQNIDLERHSIKEWISKIDPELIFKLESLL